MNILPFNRTESEPCEDCLCGDICERYPADGTDAEKDEWLAECERVAIERGGFRPCGGGS